MSAAVQHKILVVEDDADIMRILIHTLGAAGYRVVPAYGGEDALRKAKKEIPDLILTDLAMPKVTGVELIQMIKKDPDLHHIPVLAVTAHVWDGIAQSAGQVGCDGFIAKPFDTKRLLSEVEKYLSHKPAPGR